MATFTQREQIFASSRSVVYRARRDDGKPVVLKLLRGPSPSGTDRARFEREHQLALRAKGPRISEVLGFESVGDGQALVMADSGASDCATRIRLEPMSVDEAIRFGIELAKALEHLHSNGIIHRDINPANLLWGGEAGTLEVIDFGISSIYGRLQVEAAPVTRLEGTLAYIAPEQTGRTNRATDTRADLYAAGATLFHSIAGAPPFAEYEGAALVHAHLATAPPDLADLAPETAGGLDAVVAMLLAKDPDDRYQSASGLRRDLERLRDGEVGFALRTADRKDRPRAPERLFGRAHQIATLEGAFVAAAQGGAGVVLVAGAAGLGKSSLVAALHEPVLQLGGSLLSGKFDQIRSGEPYTAWVGALGPFFEGLQGLDSTELAAWMHQVELAAGASLGLLCDLIPELAALFPDREPAQEYTAEERRNALHGAVQRLTAVLGSPEHPVVVFLDDLQWADTGSLELLEAVAADAAGHHLLVVAAYRSDEVGPLLTETLARLGPISRIEVEPLREDHVRELLTATFGALANLPEVARLCLDRTAGNPFYLGEFIAQISRSGALELQVSTGRWRVDVDAASLLPHAANVVALLTARAAELPEASRAVLRAAAAIGHGFDVALVARVLDRPIEDVEAALAPCVDHGLVVPLGRSAEQIDQMRFAHDRIQQALYTGGDAQLHLAIATVLRDTREEGRTLFEAVGHLSKASSLLTSEAQRLDLVRLIARAQTAALDTGVPSRAAELSALGLELAPDNLWELDHETALTLHLGGAEAAVLLPDRDPHPLLDAMERNSAAQADQARVSAIRVAAYKASGDTLRAVEHALRGMDALGRGLPHTPGQLTVVYGLVRTQLALRGIEPSALLEAERLTDPLHEAALRLAADVIPPAYFARPNLLPLCAFQITRDTVQHGSSRVSPYGLVVYGLVLCTTGDFDGGYSWGETAVELSIKLGNPQIANLTRHLFNTHVRFWKDPLRVCAAELEQVHRIGVEVGDFEYASFGGYMHSLMQAHNGSPMSVALPTAKRISASIERMQQTGTHHQQRLCLQYLQNLAGEGNETIRLAGPTYDETEMLPVHEAAGDRMCLFQHQVSKLQLAVIFGDGDMARAAVEAGAPNEASAASSIMEVLFVVFGALGLILEGSPRSIKKARAFRKRVAAWAKAGPTNYAHHLELIDAELAATAGEVARAIDGYERAMSLARENGFTQHWALATERAAAFHLRRGDAQLGRLLVRDARSIWEGWGAAAKVAALDTQYRDQLLSFPRFDSNAGTRATGTVSEVDVMRLLELTAGIARAQGAPLAALASEALTVHGGAQRAELVWNGLVLGGDALDEADLPAVLVRRVLRNGKPIVFADAKVQAEALRDPWVARQRPTSLAVLPLRDRNQAVCGAAVLQNDLSREAFPSSRLPLLMALADHIGVALHEVP